MHYKVLFSKKLMGDVVKVYIDLLQMNSSIHTLQLDKITKKRWYEWDTH